MMKVLLVDDDIITHKIVTLALQKNFEVVGEMSGARAVERAEEVKPQVILLDLSMPNIDGFEVLTHLKRHPILADIPVICISGKLDEESHSRAYRAGASGFINKPINPAQIGRDVEQLLKAMNTEVVSKDQRLSVYIGRNGQASGERMKSSIAAALANNENVLVLSINSGETFFENFDNEFLKSGQIAYLEIKPSLIVRLPYLEDLSSLTDDIQGLLPSASHNYRLYFEAPEQIVNILDQEKSAATIISLSEVLAKNFLRVDFFTRYSEDEIANKHINNMAKLLTRIA